MEMLVNQSKAVLEQRLAELNKVYDAYKAEGYDNVLDVVLDERRLELCFEGHRAFDLYRNSRSIDRRFAGVHVWEVLDVESLDELFPYCIPAYVIDETGISGNGKN